MNTDDDPDWEALAAEGEEEERKREFWLRAVECNQRIADSKPLLIQKLKPESRLIVTFCGDHSKPAEFTVLDPASGTVIIKDENDFPEGKEGKLIGSEDLEAITPGTPLPCKKVLLPGQIKLLCWLVYELDGRRAKSNPNTISKIEIVPPGMKESFDLWRED
jgi:hypothetical protein